MSIRSYTTLDLLRDLAASLTTAEEVFGATSQEAAILVRPLLFIHTNSGNLTEGIAYALKLRRFYEKTANANAADYHNLLSRIAKLYSQQALWDDAAAQYDSIIALKKESEDIAGELQATLQLARCYIQIKKYTEAASLLNQYIDRQGPLLVQAYAYLAQACAHFDAAQADRALQKQQETIEDRGPDPVGLFDENVVPQLSLLCGMADSALSAHA